MYNSGIRPRFVGCRKYGEVTLATKHELIIQHIIDLEVGSKISVRQIAKDMSVSDGTAYRAIKEAENQGIVSTIERVGTIRIKQKQKENIETLTFAEVVKIIEGQVLGGKEGLHKTLNKFVIGAMEVDAMMRYIDAGSLLIVGNREEAHRLALESGAAVLITGGFDTSDEIKQLANEKHLPILSSTYDSFTVATMINRAIYDQLIKKEIIVVSDILIPISETHFLHTQDTVEKWHKLNKDTNHSRYPVIDQTMKVHGVVTSKDIIGKDYQTTIEKVMTKHPITVSENTSLATAAHTMIWDGIELLPVVNNANKLLGIISRRDVLKALQLIQQQPQVGETFEELIASRMQEIVGDSNGFYRAEVTPQMTNHLGTISYGVFTSLVTEAGSRALRKHKKGELVVENLTLYFIKPVQIDAMIDIYPRVLEIGRKFGKVDVEIFHKGTVVGKAMMMAQLIDRH
jgi:predicted transcriptional regulator